MVGGGGGGLVATGGGLGVDSGALVGHIGDKSVIAVGGVLHMLDPAVGKSHRVGSGNIGGTIGGLLRLEVGLGVVISHGVGEGVGALLGEVIGDISSLGGGVIGGGGVDHRGGIGGGGVDGVSEDGGGMNGVDSSVVSEAMVGERGGVDSVVDGGMDKRGVDGVSHVLGGDRVEGDNSGLALGDGAVSEHRGLDLSQALGVVSLGHTGVGGAESLALGQGSHLVIYTY